MRLVTLTQAPTLTLWKDFETSRVKKAAKPSKKPRKGKRKKDDNEDVEEEAEVLLHADPHPTSWA